MAVSGGIAAYKALDLVSSLRKRGDGLSILMTEAAMKFVSPITFSSVGNAAVYTDPFKVENGFIPHTALSRWAEIFVVAPATANTIAKIANGIADGIVTMAALAFDGPKILVPSMNVRMYENPVTMKNISALSESGWTVVEPGSGHLADGETGRGRYPDTEAILFEIDRLSEPKDLERVRFLVTAGPTREAVDPVRYLTNRSSGKMGYEIAKNAVLRGAIVDLVSGPVDLPEPYGVKVHRVESAEEMRQKTLELYENADVAVMAAAVADYRPDKISDQKIKKSGEDLGLRLVRTKDIVSELAKRKKGGQFVVGFAAETSNLLEYAQSKLEKKGLDMIVANDVSGSGIGFGSDYNEATVLCKDSGPVRLKKQTKSSLAKNILDIVKKHRFK